VSYIVKNSDKHNIAGIINKQQTTNLPPALSVSDFKDRSKAYVKIQDGCENRCSYCKVPLVRKDIVSKSIRDVVAEVSALVEKGFKEIVLTGICLGAWGRDIYPEKIVSSLGLKSAGIADILKAIDALPGDFRVRLSSIEPKYVTDDLIHLMSGGGRVCRHLHIPLQSGDDDILRRMNRPYSSAYYMALIEKLRSSVKDIALTTDILIGFPGETEAHFNNTLEFLKSIAPARTHIFTFSPREGTAAYGMESSLSSGDMEERYRRLSVAASEASYGYRRTFLNRRLDILVETVRDKSTGSLKGYSDNYIKVCFDGPDELMRKIVPVIITAADHTRTAGAYGR
jgi:threonylcarbamoyladenosine tRNA methylthiotransferase MtaB